MAGIYIHIPFCRQTCSYCNFHFSTSLGRKDQMLAAIREEIRLRSVNPSFTAVETIYFGGGTPSLLKIAEIRHLLTTISDHFSISSSAEITIECNPDDMHEQWVNEISETGINRISLGIQSFHDRELELMRRVHNSEQALKSLELLMALPGMEVSADLIYGLPGMRDESWLDNLKKVQEYQVSHLSCYALTIEPDTILARRIARGQFSNPSDELQSRHFDMLMDWADRTGYEHYEISNFSLPGHRARHNSAYWEGKPYLGFGPSAHSFDGQRRQWNIANNTLYIRSLEEGTLPCEEEILTSQNKYNEYIMTGLRTDRGVRKEHVAAFGDSFLSTFEETLLRQMQNGFIAEPESGRYVLTRKGKHFADRVASEFFVVGEGVE